MSVPGLFTTEVGAETTPDPILDAALDVFADIGVRRATVDDIAKRAGVGRVTVYRRIGGRNEVLSAVLIREASRLFSDVRAAAEAADTYADRVVTAFATTVTTVRGNPVWNRLIELEPASVLEQLTLNGTYILSAAVEATADILRTSDTTLDDDELASRAEILVRITHSILLTPQVRVPLTDYADVEKFARDHLLAIAGPGGH